VSPKSTDIWGTLLGAATSAGANVDDFISGVGENISRGPELAGRVLSAASRSGADLDRFLETVDQSIFERPAPTAPTRPTADTQQRVGNAPNQTGQVFPLGGKSENAPNSTYHLKGGSDLMAPRGTPVLSMQHGTVTDIYRDNGSHTVGGNGVMIKGDDGLDYYYAHFDKPPALKPGQRVEAGAQIGEVGNSGNAWKDGKGATHLHIGIGHGISNGVGAEGGLGMNYDAQQVLVDLLGGLGKGTSTPTRTPETRNLGPAANGIGQGPLQDYARQAAVKAGIDPDLFTAQIQQESGFNPKAGSSAGAQGVAQIVPKYHPNVDPADPYASLDYAANLMRSHLNTYKGDYAKALVAYNGGGGAVAQYDKGHPYQESQTYLDRILGSSRPNLGELKDAAGDAVGGALGSAGSAIGSAAGAVGGAIGGAASAVGSAANAAVSSLTDRLMDANAAIQALDATKSGLLDSLGRQSRQAADAASSIYDQRGPVTASAQDQLGRTARDADHSQPGPRFSSQATVPDSPDRHVYAPDRKRVAGATGRVREAARQTKRGHRANAGQHLLGVRPRKGGPQGAA